MVDLYRYTDYRAYWRDWFDENKKTQGFLSFRYMARKTGVDAGYIAHVFQGSKHIAEASIGPVMDLLGLKGRDGKFFHELVLFSRAKNDREIKERFQKLMLLRSTCAKQLSDRQTRYWSFWYYPAVRLALLTFDFKGDYADLAQRLTPKITVEQAKDAVKTLVELELIRKEKNGVYSVLDAHVATQDAWQSLAIREFQKTTLDLARESLDRHLPAEREISTMTLAIPAKEIPTLQEMVREFRRQVAQWTLSLEDSDCVMQANFALFPLAKTPQEEEKALPKRRSP